VQDRSDREPAAVSEGLRVAVLGCGGVARQYHLPVLRADPRVELVGAADPAPESRRAAAAADSRLELFADPLDLLDALTPDAAVVCAATPAHAELAAAAAGRGIHLYLEKPVATDERGAEAVLAAAAASAAVAQVGFNLRFHPQLIELRRLLSGRTGSAEGAVVGPRRARATLIEKLPARAGVEWKRRRSTGGGALLDLGSHAFDLARWLFGEEIAAIDSAEVRSERSEHDGASVALTLSSGTAVELTVGFGPEAVHRWEIAGSQGHRSDLRFDAWPPRVSRGVRHPLGWELGRRARAVLPIPRREPSFAPALGAFVAAASTGEPGERRELPTIGDGVASLRAVLAAERAAGLR
jgi:predicted dehydrogenase